MDDEIIEEVLEGIPKSLSEIERMSISSILIVSGAYISIGLGIMSFVLFGFSTGFSGALFRLIVNLSFGFGLLLSYIRLERDIAWPFMAAIFSIILILLGGPIGTIGGLFALIGSSLYILGDLEPEFRI